MDPHRHRHHSRYRRPLFPQVRLVVTAILLIHQAVPQVSAFGVNLSGVGMVFDFLKPYYNRIEKQVASKGIPDMSGLSNRL
jgi:hypothetical protein